MRQVGLYALLAVVFWAGAFGIAFGVVEWRGNTETAADTIQFQPSPTPQVDPIQCQAAIALFEAVDAVLERASNPTENLQEEWGRAAQNMDKRCLVATPTPPSN